MGGGERSTPYTVAGSSLALQLTAHCYHGLPEGNWSATSLGPVKNGQSMKKDIHLHSPCSRTRPYIKHTLIGTSQPIHPKGEGNQALAEHTCGSVMGERYKGFGCLLSKTR